MSSDDFIIYLDPDEQPKNKPKEQWKNNVETERDYYAEYIMLLTASQFLSAIQKIALYADDLGEHDTSDIVKLIKRQQKSPADFTPEMVRALIYRLDDFRKRIEATDEYVQTANVRRLFEEIGMPDSAAFERVIRYYLTKKNKTQNDRDKIDLLVTRWGSFRIPGHGRTVFLRSERNLVQRLEKIFNELKLESTTEFSQSDVLEWLERYRGSLLAVQSMSEMVEKGYKNKLREFKVTLGDFFHNPQVLASIVETNITLHNILHEFYLSERARLELFVDHARRKTGDLQPLPSEGTEPIFSLMSRAEEMRRILDETQAAISSQQVVDQPSPEANSRVDELVTLLEQTLQKTNELSRQIQQEVAKRLEK
jgi:hypothetical protein